MLDYAQVINDASQTSVSHLPPTKMPPFSRVYRYRTKENMLVILYSLSEPGEESGSLFLGRKFPKDLRPRPYLISPGVELLQPKNPDDEWFFCSAETIHAEGWSRYPRVPSRAQAEKIKAYYQANHFHPLTPEEISDWGSRYYLVTAPSNFGKDWTIDYLVRHLSYGCHRLPLTTTREPRSQELQDSPRRYDIDNLRHLFIEGASPVSRQDTFCRLIEQDKFISWRKREPYQTYYGLDYRVARYVFNRHKHGLILTSCGLRLGRMIQLQFAIGGGEGLPRPLIIYGQALDPRQADLWQREREQAEDIAIRSKRMDIHDGLAHQWADYIVWMQSRGDLAIGVEAIIDKLKRQ